MKTNRNTSKENLDHLKKISEDLESMLLNTEIPGVKEAVKGDIPLSSSTIKPLNYDQIKVETDQKAEEIVESVVLLYLPPDFIYEHDYVRQKMSVDKLTVSNLIFQMKTAEHAIKKLLEEIDGGNIHARSFEVLASLQKSKMEIVKHLAQFMVVMENNYKNLKFDYENSKAENVKSIEAGETPAAQEGSLKFRGTKGLISALNAAMTEHFENTEFEELKNDDPTE
jgi:uncharacterized lipoprotein YehR (DUF1307 family)